jgi:hypothetical protein
MNSSNYGWIFGLIVIAALGIGLWALWAYVWRLIWPSIKHWLIKSNSEPASAVILETKKIGSEIQVSSGGTRYSHTNTEIYQPVRVKLEIHPNNGAPYIAYDKFNAHWYPTGDNQLKEPLTPGNKLQVAVSRLNPQWVVALLETLPPPYEQKLGLANVNTRQRVEQMRRDGHIISQQDYANEKLKATSEEGLGYHVQGSSSTSTGSTSDAKGQLEKLQEMLTSGLITQQDYDKKKAEILAKM